MELQAIKVVWLRTAMAAICATLPFAAVDLPACAQALEPGAENRTTYGSIGLVEMPSARMAPDGEISFSTFFTHNTQRYTLGFQALPWLNATFHYSGLTHFPSIRPTYWDRSLTIDMRLFTEGEYRPSIVLGLRDMLGTGIYRGEYIVASKHILDDFDVTAGLGWGELSEAESIPNPFGYLSSSFRTQQDIYTTAGAFSLSTLFHGPHVGLFGGVVWRSPIPGLSITAEYSSDSYDDPRRFAFSPRNQFNLAANYQISNSTQIGLSWLYGTAVGINLTFTGDPTKNDFPISMAPAPLLAVERPADEQISALYGMLDHARHPPPVTVVNSAEAKRSGYSYFAGAVFTAGSSARDVEIKGRRLIIRTVGTEIVSSCRVYAHDAAATLNGIEEIELVGSDGNKRSCALPRLTQNSRDVPGAIKIFPVLISRQPEDTLIDSPAAPERTTAARARAEIVKDAGEQMLDISAVAAQGSELTVYYRNNTYGGEAEAAGRMIRVLMKDAPPDIEIFHLIVLTSGIPSQTFNVLREPMERLEHAQEFGRANVKDAVAIDPPPMWNPILDREWDTSFPHFAWDIGPSLQEGLFDPTQPIRFSIAAALNGELDLTQHLMLTGTVQGNIWNNIDSGTIAASALPPVRTDTALYYRKGATGIGSLMAQYRFRLTPAVNVLLKGGYLESMFGGAGGEVLWHPETSRLAFGIDVYEVWQRNFDRLFGLRSYHVFTGHASIYYQSPWYHLNFHLMAGQYLAGDHGITFEATRRFDTGVEIGVFATFTNVSAQQFGEGSFDKGFIIRIPLEWALPIPTQNEVAMTLRPITGNGGQRLDGDTQLYDELQRSNYGEVTRHFQDFVNPPGGF